MSRPVWNSCTNEKRAFPDAAEALTPDQTPDVLGCTHPRTPESAMSATMTVRLETDLKNRLEKLSEATQRSKSFLAAEAIRDFVELNEWQVSEIQDALAEADRGDFASDELVGEVFGKWGVRAR